MSTQSKNTLGQLLDANGNVISDILIHIVLIQLKNLDGRPAFQASGVVKGY